MWTPHLKKWGSTDPLDPVAPAAVVTCDTEFGGIK